MAALGYGAWHHAVALGLILCRAVHAQQPVLVGCELLNGESYSSPSFVIGPYVCVRLGRALRLRVGEGVRCVGVCRHARRFLYRGAQESVCCGARCASRCALGARWAVCQPG